MHAEAFAFVQGVVRTLPPRRLVVELGGRNFNGSIRPLFAGAEAYISVDLRAGCGVDVIGDAATYTPPEPPDTVVCCEVLEHAPNADAVVANALRILAPGGVLVLTCATDPRLPHSSVDGNRVRPGEHYANVPPEDLAAWLAGADVRILDSQPWGDLQCLAVKQGRES